MTGILRTPENRFQALPGYDFAPRYVELTDTRFGPLRLHYLDEGPGDAPVIVLLHGQGCWSYMYRKVIPRLVGRGYRTVAPDYIGFGRSDKLPSTDDYSFRDHVDWLLAFLRALGLVGTTGYFFDWGGFFGLRIAAEHPEIFSRIALSNTTLPTGVTAGTEWFINWRERQFALPRFPQGEMVDDGVVRKLSPEVIAAYDAPYPDEHYKTGPRRFPMILPITPEDPAAADNARAWQVLSGWERPVLTIFSASLAGTSMGPERLLRHIPGCQGQPHSGDNPQDSNRRDAGMAGVEFGIVMEPSAGYTARLAAEIEALGFDALLCPDTQCLSHDPYGQLSLAAASTRRLFLGTGVTNPLTRDASVTACALATLQLESGGRARCGIGRGDSSAAHIGRRNATTAELRVYVEQVRGYLQGQVVPRSEASSRIRWLAPGQLVTVPLDLACTGPATIRLAADVADRVTFAVGSAPERVEWALTTLRQRLAETGRDRRTLQVGAYVNLVCDPDEVRAIGLGRMIAGMVAHFAGMKHSPVDHLPPKLKPVAVQMQSGYDMARHAQNEGGHLELITDDFVDWFSICGPPAKCVDRLGSLISLGLDYVNILGGSPVPSPHGARQEAMVRQTRLFAEQVMPRFR